MASNRKEREGCVYLNCPKCGTEMKENGYRVYGISISGLTADERKLVREGEAEEWRCSTCKGLSGSYCYLLVNKRIYVYSFTWHLVKRYDEEKVVFS